MNQTDRSSGLDQKSIILQGAIENTNEGFVTIDEHHRVIVFNKAAEKIFGYTLSSCQRAFRDQRAQSACRFAIVPTGPFRRAA